MLGIDAPVVLNAALAPAGSYQTEEIIQSLSKTVSTFKAEAMDDGGHRMDYAVMRASKAFQRNKSECSPLLKIITLEDRNGIIPPIQAMTTKLSKHRSNEEWIEALSDPVSDEVLSDLRATLLRGLRAALSNRVEGDLDSLTEDFVQDALLKILNSLESFRGESQFTTWAQKIAIHVAFSELRRRRWKDISLQSLIETPEGEEYTPAILTDPGVSPELETTQLDVMQIVEDLVFEELTDRQRTAMLAILQGNMPISEVARKMDTNPNALYKLMHDARKRLQEKLKEKAGLSTEEVLALFENE